MSVPQDDIQQLGEHSPHLRETDEVLLRRTNAIEQFSTALRRLLGLIADVDVHLRADHPLRFTFFGEGNNAPHILHPFP